MDSHIYLFPYLTHLFMPKSIHPRDHTSHTYIFVFIHTVHTIQYSVCIEEIFHFHECVSLYSMQQYVLLICNAQNSNCLAACVFVTLVLSVCVCCIIKCAADYSECVDGYCLQ